MGGKKKDAKGRKEDLKDLSKGRKSEGYAVLDTNNKMTQTYWAKKKKKAGEKDPGSQDCFSHQKNI